MKKYYWQDPLAEERQSLGIEFWIDTRIKKIIGYCSEEDIIWNDFFDAIDGFPGKPRTLDMNVVPDGTMLPASKNEIIDMGFKDYISGSY